MYQPNTNVSNCTEIQMWLDFLEEFTNGTTYWSDIILKILNCLIFLANLFGNSLTCVVIYCDKTMHTTTNYYLFNLAISDLIMSFAILLQIVESLIQSSSYCRISCKLHYFILVTLFNNTVLILTAIAIERYFGICYSLKMHSKRRPRRSVVKIISLVWVIAVLETLPEAYLVDLIALKNTKICYILPTPTVKIVSGVMGLLCFILPLAIMMFVYFMIAFEVNLIQTNSLRGNNFNHRDYRTKVNKLIVMLTLSFLLCWLPFFIIRTLFLFEFHQIVKLKYWWRLVFDATLLCCWFSTVLNPILFNLMSTKFRNALKKLWGKTAICTG